MPASCASSRRSVELPGLGSFAPIYARKGLESGRSWVRSDSLPVGFVRLPGRSALPHHKGWCAILADIRISPDEFLRLLQS
jgi:hypothetical protein